MQKRVLILTGNPGVGKTTVLMKTVNTLKERGISVGGMISREAREGGRRVGFEVLDLSSGRRGWLAHVNQEGPRVGRYHVNLEDLDSIGAKAISEAVAKSDVVAIDEIGPMELFLEKFRETVSKALDSPKLVIAVVHLKAKDRLIHRAGSREDSETYTVTIETRDKLPETLVREVLYFLKAK